MTWWAGPLDDAVLKGYTDNSPFSVPRLWPDVFGARGVVPIGMAVLALAVGVTAGLVVRRTVAAMALTLATIVAVQIVMPVFVQAHLMAPETRHHHDHVREPQGFHDEWRRQTQRTRRSRWRSPATDPAPGSPRTGRWTPTGNLVEFLPAWAIGVRAGTPGGSRRRGGVLRPGSPTRATGSRSSTTRPRDFWAMQWRETGLLLGLAALLTGFCFWRIRRDLT